MFPGCREGEVGVGGVAVRLAVGAEEGGVAFGDGECCGVTGRRQGNREDEKTHFGGETGWRYGKCC